MLEESQFFRFAYKQQEKGFNHIGPKGFKYLTRMQSPLKTVDLCAQPRLNYVGNEGLAHLSKGEWKYLIKLTVSK